jgi:hypothetical protein
MKFNINENVRVRLTESGRRILLESGRSIPREDLNGWSEWQLWVLMEAFGPHLHIGVLPTPFETEIELVIDEPGKQD